MFCSAIIPTINRPTLSRAVCSVLNQKFCADEFEVIVVNDSGEPLDDMEWQHSTRVRTIITQRRERSVARNTGAALARGRYLYFLDDDDVMLPGAMQAFWELAQQTQVPWIYGSYQIVDNDGKLIEEFLPYLEGNVFGFLVAGEGIPLQASLLRVQEFYAAGEFDAYFTGAQDRDLGRRMALLGDVAQTPALITRIRVGPIRSSTAWSTLPEFDRVGREKALNLPGAFTRLWNSAKGNDELRGRVSRAYLASAVWNLRHKKIFQAASRLVSMGFLSVPYVLTSGFWRGLRTRVQELGEIRPAELPADNEFMPVALLMTMVLVVVVWIVLYRWIK